MHGNIEYLVSVASAIRAEVGPNYFGVDNWKELMEEIIRSLLTGDFQLPMSECALRQCGLDSPIIYEGPGLLTQEPNKSIRLRVFAAHVDEAVAFDRQFNRNLTPGVLVPDSQYFDFEGKDPYGTFWRVNRLSIETNFGARTDVRARPRILEKTEVRPNAADWPSVSAFFPGKIELPWHTASKRVGREWSVDLFEKQTARVGWRIFQADEGVWLNFKCENSPVQPRFEAFLRGLSILTGRWLKPICLSIFEGERVTTRIVNRLHEPDSEKLLPPIGSQMDFAEDAHVFLERFMGTAADEEKVANGPHELAHRYWHRILRARENDIENSSLVLSVAVEGLVKKTLLSSKDVDPELVKEAEEAKPILENVGLSRRALGIVRSSLGNAIAPRVQNTLRRLTTTGVTSEAHLKAWTDLRNPAAHGSVLDDDETALQQHLDRFHLCIDLYYRLLFHLIGYEGRHTDYGAEGWPTRAFRASVDAHLPASGADEMVSCPGSLSGSSEPEPEAV